MDRNWRQEVWAGKLREARLGRYERSGWIAIRSRTGGCSNETVSTEQWRTCQDGGSWSYEKFGPRSCTRFAREMRIQSLHLRNFVKRGWCLQRLIWRDWPWGCWWSPEGGDKLSCGLVWGVRRNPSQNWLHRWFRFCNLRWGCNRQT